MPGRSVRSTHRCGLLAVLAALAVGQTACSPHSPEPVRGEVWYMGLSEPERPTLFMYSVGQGDPVLVLHGGPGAEHSYLIDLVEPLAGERRFVLYDQRGSLRSPAPDSLLTFPDLVDDVEWIRQELGVERLTLLGHSFGTRVAMAYADAHPDRVERLVLMGSLPVAVRVPERITDASQLPPPPFHLASQYLGTRPEVQEVMREHGVSLEDGRDVLELSHRERSRRLRIRLAADNIYDVSKWRQANVGIAFFNPNAAQLISGTAPEPFDYEGSLRSGGFPVTVINGDHDFAGFTALGYEELLARVMPDADPVPADAMALVRSIAVPWGDLTEGWPQLEVYEIENAGHNAWIDRPEETARLLRRALTRE
jgi:proline iminopeptidase